MNRDEAYRLIAGEATIWAMVPDCVASMAAALASGVKAARPAPPSGTETVAIVPIMGVLTPRSNIFTEFFGGTSYQQIRTRLRDAIASRAVTRVLLYIDSPGGAAMGVEELAAEIAAANKIKPVVGHVEGLMGSAACWLGTQAGAVYATPSSEAGSIGVFSLHVDASRMFDSAGLTPTFIVSRASPHKVEGNPLEPLSAEAKAYAQGQVDEIATRFVRAVARGRSVGADVVRRDFGGGRMLFAGDAAKVGMINGVAASPDVALGRATTAAAAAVVSRHAALNRLRAPSPREAETIARRQRLEELRE